MNPWKFIVENFKRMPRSVQVTVYLFVFALFVYLNLLPRFVLGECFITQGPGRELPLRDQFISYVVEGRSLKIKVNDEGLWAVPVISRLPKGVDLRLLNQNDESYQIIHIPFTRLWSNNRIVYHAGSDSFALEDYKKPGLLSNWGPRSAFAQDMTTVFPKDSLYALIERSLGVRGMIDSGYGRTVNIQRRLSRFDRIDLLVQIEKTLGVRISDEKWRTLLTVDEIVEYLDDRVNRQKIRFDYYKSMPQQEQMKK